MIAARGKPHGIRGVPQEFHALAVRRRDRIQNSSLRLCVNAEFRTTEGLEAIRLYIAGSGDTRRDLLASFGRGGNTRSDALTAGTSR